MNITPQNRHLLIEVIDETEDNDKPAAFLLPEGYEKPKSEHVKVRFWMTQPVPFRLALMSSCRDI